MRIFRHGLGVLVVALAARMLGAQNAATMPALDTANDPVKLMVARLDLERYKTTIKGLTRFGDRRQGTDRNRAAVDWIEAQLKSYGCTNTERITYDYQPPAGRGGGRRRGGAGTTASGGGRLRGIRGRTGVNTDPNNQPNLALRELN